MFTPEVKFCVKYLLENGVNSVTFVNVVKELSPNDTRFDFVKLKRRDTEFFDELAQKLRELWPAGEKDGKWPWRDSVPNLSRRLETLWKDRNIKDKSIDDCLTVARKYLAQFEENAKYMQTLKYFILKQDKIVLQNGRAKIINKSVFADMLESNASMDEWNSIFESNDISQQGELI